MQGILLEGPSIGYTYFRGSSFSRVFRAEIDFFQAAESLYCGMLLQYDLEGSFTDPFPMYWKREGECWSSTWRIAKISGLADDKGLNLQGLLSRERNLLQVRLIHIFTAAY